MAEPLPALLTVEEAARLLRVGRTKAYAMAREWRETGGRSGLPVLDFGAVLRVPTCGLAAMLGGPLTMDQLRAAQTAMDNPDQPLVESTAPTQEPCRDSRPSPRTSSSPRRSRTPDHPTLPFAS